MANVQRVLNDFRGVQAYPVKGSVANIEVGDMVYFDSRFQADAAQNTIRPASSGSAGSSAADGRFQFAANFVGVSHQRHDVNTYDKGEFGVSVDCEVEMIIANSTGAQTVANAEIDAGTLVGIAVTGAFIPIDDMVQVDGLHSVTVAANEAIGRLSRRIRNNDRTCRVHIVGMHVMGQTGV